jgi:hypothetical protein
MSDVFKLQRGVAMSTLFFGHDSFPLDRESDSGDGPDGAGLAPVTWLPARGRDEEDNDSTRGY